MKIKEFVFYASLFAVFVFLSMPECTQAVPPARVQHGQSSDYQPPRQSQPIGTYQVACGESKSVGWLRCYVIDTRTGDTIREF